MRARVPAEAPRCVRGQDTLLSLCLSSPRCIMGTGEFTAGGTLRWTSIPSLHSRENRLSFCLMSKLARMQTLPSINNASWQITKCMP